MAEDRPRIDLMQALKSPMRVRILEMFTRDTSRQMMPGPVTEALASSLPGVQRKQVAYHLTILREARLIPAAD